MNRIAGRLTLGGILMVMSGCDGLLPQNPAPNTVTVTFVNNAADSGVSVNFFSSSDAAISSGDLTNTAISEQLAFSLDPAATFQFARACTDFRAAVVDSASLVGGTGAASTGVLVDGMDFACGNFITFTISSQDAGILSIDVGIGDSDPLSAAETTPKEIGANRAANDNATGNGSGAASDSAADAAHNANSNGTDK